MADVRSRQGWYSTLQRLEVTVKALDVDTVTTGDLKAHLENAERIWRKLDDAHSKILSTVADDSAFQVQQDAVEPMSTLYYNIKSTLYTLQNAKSSGGGHHHSAHIKLPDIQIKKFSGNYEDWPTFQDLFLASIDKNPSLSGSQKLTYLKSYTTDQAASMINSFVITDANYKEAWKLLEQHYDNQREIVNCHIRNLLFQPPLKESTPAALQQLLTTTMESIRSLKVLGRPTDQWDDIVSVIIIEKFDSDTKSEWARSLKGSDPTTFEEVQDFIQQHIRTLHARGAAKPGPQRFQNNQTLKRKISNNHTTFSACLLNCGKEHPIYKCIKFEKMTPDVRSVTVKSANLCFNCLRGGHSMKDCSSQATCKKCGKRHNTMLHTDKTVNQSTSGGAPPPPPSAEVETRTTRINSTSFSGNSPVLMKTAVGNVVDSNNVKHSVRIFIDDGGQAGLIREARMKQLNLRKQRVDVTVTGVGDKFVTKSKWRTFLRLHSQYNDSFIDVELFAVPSVSEALNKMNVKRAAQWTHLEGLQLADPEYWRGEEVDILLGSDIAPYILTGGIKKLNMGAPVAQETMFGWVLSGNTGTQTVSSLKINQFKCVLSEALRRFWEIEEVPSKATLTIEENVCEKHFESTHFRRPDGRYVVRMPFNEKKQSLGTSRDQAVRRLMSLEKRFRIRPEYKEAYVAFMREYESMGHMQEVPATDSASYYLPHHFVLKEDSSTTKQRTVFDGSAKTSTGVSLNDALIIGPTVQPDLYTLLLKFRYNPIALKADIAKMYRQFVMHEDDRDFQRILWREECNQPIKEYQLTTVTYGEACAPYQATRCLNQLATDEGKRFPAAAEALTTSTYVDDFLGSSPSMEHAKKLVQELIGITATAGMSIRKWCSNSKEVIETIPPELREECDIADIGDGSPSSIKALGIKWEPSSDTFLFNVNISNTMKTTKRFVLSEISKTFDPLGWLSPVTINAKLLMQKIWLAGCDWDSPIPEQLQREWTEHISNLEELKTLRVPRCVIKANPVKMELHGFSDSSEVAFACAVYLKCVYAGDIVDVNLLTSRSRVAPVKCVSLPKLELCAAKLLAETIEVVQSSFSKPIRVSCYTDSTITLRWITSHSRKWKTFVANRVSDIQGIVSPEHWSHVRTKDNPADLPSRGITSEQLRDSALWWHGPSQLLTGDYPSSAATTEADEEEMKKEEKTKRLINFHLNCQSTHDSLFNQFSSFGKLCRITAIWIRFIKFLKEKRIHSKTISALDVSVAANLLIKWAQSTCFGKELIYLTKGEGVHQTSKLLQLSPFIDHNGLIRVGGRIQKSHAPDNMKHPIILPHNHRITQLIIDDCHRNHLHSGFSLTFSSLKRKYWILRGRDTVRNFIRKCVKCRRAKATVTTQLMGNLPTGRVTANRPFLHSGVDFAGPFQVKIKKGRFFTIDKVYFCIFVCLSTKAVHLESVSSLSSDDFIACYERFSSRRGVSAQLYSDCGTNFVGANTILFEFLRDQQQRVQELLTVRGTSWIFNPPAAPHQGGLWEAGVKSVKHHFNRVVGQQVLTYEQFVTLLCRIEAVLNSRPLVALSSDPNDAEALTPGHFLIGEPLTAIPEPDVMNINQNRLKYWEQVRQLTQHFWKRWHAEYLTTLQQRYKWTKKRDNIQVGDLVVIADDQMPVARWRLGRVKETYPGQDGLVRSVLLKTAWGELKRPISKLSPLINNNDM